MDAFYALAVLACPVGMGAMMFFMMKGTRPKSDAPQTPAGSHGKAADWGDVDAALREQEAAALRQEVAELRAKIESRPEAPSGERT